ncbi:MAG: hypothetical protein J0H41_18005 [Rhizobiales bacterium]|nr:hypothetical protein [Hyphomicrobiales bacterium]
MKARFVFALACVGAIVLPSAAAWAEERLAIEPAIVVASATEADLLLPLPPTRPTATQRRARVSQASVAGPQVRLAAAPVRKPSQIWLTMGYGF